MQTIKHKSNAELRAREKALETPTTDAEAAERYAVKVELGRRHGEQRQRLNMYKSPAFFTNPGGAP